MWSLVLGALAVTAAAVRTFGKSKASTSDSSTKDVSEVGDKSLAKAQSSLKLRFLVVMLVVRFSDWLQGPYFYDLYSVKIDSRTGQQFTPGAVSTLFLVGFCSGMLFGTLAGSLSDTFGRCVARFSCTKSLIQCSCVALFPQESGLHLLSGDFCNGDPVGGVQPVRGVVLGQSARRTRVIHAAHRV